VTLGLMPSPWAVLQDGFSGTACESCADDNLFGPNCSSGKSGYCVINAFVRVESSQRDCSWAGPGGGGRHAE
jgi:hypothetical protein